jgi:competence protein ComEC
VRARVRRSLEPIREKENGQKAAILASLVIGDYSGLLPATREAFQNAGTFHILVVSGLHVAWITGLLLQFFKWIRLPERVRYLLAAVAILVYTCVVGFQASITRCLWMFLLYLTGRMLFRRADPVNILLTSALILLAAEPDWLQEPGFQFSFLSILAIALTAVPTIRSYLKPLCDPMRHCGNCGRLFLQPGPWHRCGRNLRARCEVWIEQIADFLRPPASRALFGACRIFACGLLAAGSIILTSICVQIWIDPLLAYNFNRISWIAPVANLVLVPISSLTLTAGIFNSLVTGIPVLEPALAQCAGLSSSFLLSGAEAVTKIPGAWQRCPTPAPECVLGCVFLFFLWGFLQWRRFWIPLAAAFAMLACLSSNTVPLIGTWYRGLRTTLGGEERIWQRDAPVLAFTFLDVGEGDSIFIQFPDERRWILDAGGLRTASSLESTHTMDIGESVVSRYLWHEWIARLDRVILSHTDRDHSGGIPAVMRNFKVGRFDYPRVRSDAILDAILHLARERQTAVKPLHKGMEETVGPVKISVLNPPVDHAMKSTNDSSLVFRFAFGRFSALLTADVEKSAEQEILLQPGDLSCRLLKVAHHGSRTSTTDAFLDRAQPRWAVISAGRNNPFGHPSPEVCARLLRRGTRLILTSEEGAVKVETDGSRYIIGSHINGILERGLLR